MKTKCPICGNELELKLNQKLISDNCEAKIHFNIVELICECGEKNIVSVSPKSIQIFNNNMKILQF